MKNTLLLLSLLIFTNLMFGQFGVLDPTFNGDGKLTLNSSSGLDFAGDVIQQEDGKLIIVRSGSESPIKFMVSRRNLDGTRDESFGTNGTTIVEVSTNINYGIKGDFQEDGKIIVAGRSGGGVYNDFTCFRLNTNGTLDESFASNGIFTISLSDAMDDLNDLKVLADDKILLAGAAGTDINENFALVKLNPNGSIDTDFGDAGIVLYDVTGGSDRIKSIAITNDNKIIAAGMISDETRILIASVAQFNADGSIDTNFGDDGVVSITPGPWASFFNGVVINSDNTIVSAGVLDYDSQYDFMAAKFNSDGSIFTQFADNGIFTKAYDGNSEYAASLIGQPDGKFILVGQQGLWPVSDFALLRITADGSVDNTFGNEGLVTTDFDNGYDYTAGSTLQADGKVVACGAATNNDDYQLAVSRYTTGVGVGTAEQMEMNISLTAFPNPLSNMLTINFELEKREELSIELFDLSGRMVQVLAQKRSYQPGKHSAVSNTDNINQGMYLLQVKSENNVQTLKVNKL